VALLEGEDRLHRVQDEAPAMPHGQGLGLGCPCSFGVLPERLCYLGPSDSTRVNSTAIQAATAAQLRAFKQRLEEDTRRHAEHMAREQAPSSLPPAALC
jgi:hypothetical protein